MISKPLKITLAGLALVAGAGAIVFLHLSNEQLRRRIADTQGRGRVAASLSKGNEALKSLLARSQGDAEAAGRAIHEELTQVRQEVVAAERAAENRRQQLAAKAETEAGDLAANRDPRRGLTRLEHFKNRGQATPAGAFETLVWAAMKGDDAALAQVSTISSQARARAEKLIAGLPENARGQWTPEKLSAMFFTGAFNEVSAAQVVTETTVDARHAALSIRLTGGAKDATVPLQWELGADGWRVVFDEKLLGAVQKRIANEGRAQVPKK